MNSILILNLFSSFFLCGLIWSVQLVHYPFFEFSEPSRFTDAMNFHQLRISFIVIPVMLAELISSCWLTITLSEPFWVHAGGLVLVLAIWIITFFLQVPLHSNLKLRYSTEQVQKLVRSNWWRTILWTLKSLLGILLLKIHLT